MFDLNHSWNRDFETNIPVCDTVELVRNVFKECAENVYSKNCIRFFSQIKVQSRLLSNAGC